MLPEDNGRVVDARAGKPDVLRFDEHRCPNAGERWMHDDRRKNRRTREGTRPRERTLRRDADRRKFLPEEKSQRSDKQDADEQNAEQPAPSRRTTHRGSSFPPVTRTRSKNIGSPASGASEARRGARRSRTLNAP